MRLPETSQLIKIGVIFVALVLVANMAAVDLVLLQTKEENLIGRLGQLEKRVDWLVDKQTPQASVVPVVVEQEAEEVSQAVDVAAASPSPTPEASEEPVNKSQAREVFVPLGSGSTSSTGWTDTGAQAYIDSALYPGLSEVKFQASLKSNSGKVYARLAIQTDGSAIGGSEISHNTSTFTHKSSGAISLLSGNKLYVVQLKSEVGQEVFVENARLRLVTN